MKKFINTITACIVTVVTIFIIFLGIEIYKNCNKNKIINDTEIEDIIAKHFNVSDCLLKVVHTIHGESVVAEIVE